MGIDVTAGPGIGRPRKLAVGTGCRKKLDWPFLRERAMDLPLGTKYAAITAEDRKGYVLFAFAVRWFLED